MKKLKFFLVLAMACSAVAQQKSGPVVVAEAGSPAPSTQPLVQPIAAPDATALPVGTAIRVQLETPLSTAKNKVGDHFSSRVTEAVVLNGETIIPVGAAVEGEVLRVQQHRRIRGTATLALRPTLIILPDGRKYAMNASIVDTSARSLKVNDEGEIKGSGHDGADWVETGVGAAFGSGIGAAAGGFKGALIGGSIGVGASFVHWLAKKRSARLAAGTELIVELTRPMTITPVPGN